MIFGELQTLYSLWELLNTGLKKNKKMGEISKYTYFEYMTIYLGFQKYFCFHNEFAYEEPI